ncbi:MAG TPA: NADH-quinone oxidoreductase subunit M [candidate division Zixibacteria bacterium]|nr:NADH-quinone oxidoreductase subunit M [candidate division Zixibacteria bacterium]
MSTLTFGPLTWLLLLPVVGAALLLFIPRDRKGALYALSLLFTLAAFSWSLRIFALFDEAQGRMQLVERLPWMPAYGIEYAVGIDGISLFLVLLTTFLMPVAVLASWPVRERVKEYLFFMLVLETGMLGAFLALDLFLFYVFWEVMLVPMYFLIGIWGGPRRIYAALKFVIYTMAGSLLMLVAIIYLVMRHAHLAQTLTFSLLEIYELRLPYDEQLWLFLAFALSFAIKVPMFPFHTWLPDAHVEAPTAGSVILAAVLLKMGTYGFLRFAMPLFPEVALAAAPFVIAMAVIGIVYGAAVAMMQADIKKLVAYSSVSHLGFVMLGLFAFNTQGVQGSLYQMLNHGLSTGALFLLVGMIYDRRHSRLIEDFGGLWAQVPVFSALLMVVTLSSIGLPGLNGFVGEFLILLGAFGAAPGWTAVAATGMILSAVYMLWMFRRVIFGPLANPENRKLADLNARELVLMAPILVLIVFMGVYPDPFLRRMGPSVQLTLDRIAAAARAQHGGAAAQ